MRFGHTHSTIIWVRVPGVAGTGSSLVSFLIGDQPLIRFARITAIEALCADDLANGMPGGPPVIDGADLKKVTLTLNCNDPDIIPAKLRTNTLECFQNMPLTTLHRVQGQSGVPFVRQLFETYNVYPDWTKCKFELTPGGLGNTEDKCIAIQVFYTWLQVSLPGQAPQPVPRQ